MTGPIRITPGRFGAACASGADATARALLTKSGFTPARAADQPLSLGMTDGPLVFRALVGEAAHRLERAGYDVEVDPQLRLSATGEEALEVLADLRRTLDELTELLPRMDDLRELADVAAQMITGPLNVADGTRKLLRTAAGCARDARGLPHEREEIADWLDASAEALTTLQRTASQVAYPHSDTLPAARASAARTRSPAVRTTAASLTGATASVRSHAPDLRRTRA
ncbi:hypothetical protein ACIRRH_33580 [Kitasatospora sp. NPDC101235]|uniref:hypothetical protein n=1 Tax=Kitasatospora sp. NPDC101235 TaxID=3364101 RepID=UPI0037F144F4